MLKRLGIALLFVLGAVGCGPKGPVRVTIMERTHHDAWLQMMPISSGKTTMIVPIYHPETWGAVVGYYDKNDHFHTDGLSLSEQDWANVAVGDTMTVRYQ